VAPLVLGVDSSTQSTKVEIRDAEDGRVVATGRAPHPPTAPPRSEQDPADWWTALGAARSAAGDHTVAAISVAGQQHGMVVLDARREVVRPAKLWNDTESSPDADRLVAELGGAAAWAEACGSVPRAAFTITKLSWLRRNEPDAFAATHHVVLPHDWLTFRLTGKLVTDRGDASGTGYWSPRTEGWDTGLLALVDAQREWDAVLPRVLGPLEPAGQAGEAVVAAGTGDNMAAALGVGLAPGDLVISLGTSGTAFAVSERATHDASGAVAGFADASGRWLPLVCTLNATKVTDFFARLLGVDHAGLDALALQARPGEPDVVLLPYFDGERTPDRPGATGELRGLGAGVTREQLALAAFQGVVCGLLDGVDALTAAGVATSGRILLVGGGAQSAAYPQIVADLTQRVVHVADGDEHVATGACVQAAAVLRGVNPTSIARQWNLGTGRMVEPRPVDAAAVCAAYAAVRDRA
jgi:xylulokinase